MLQRFFAVVSLWFAGQVAASALMLAFLTPHKDWAAIQAALSFVTVLTAWGPLTNRA